MTLAHLQPADDSLESVDLVIGLLELFAGSETPLALSEVAQTLNISKARTHRHLRALVLRDYVRQEAGTGRYQGSARLLRLGAGARERTSFTALAAPSMAVLRDATGQTVTTSALMAGQVTITAMLQGRTVIEFGIRPGAVMSPRGSAHGLIALAFGPAEEIARASEVDLAACEAEIAQIRQQGWATAAGRMLTGVNALAAPVFDFAGVWQGSLAIVGSTDFIAARPDHEQIDHVVGAARAVSRRLGWNGHQA